MTTTLEKMAQNLARAAKPVDDVAGAAESVVLAIVARAATWGASIPNMIMVARSASEMFGITLPLGTAIAVSVELIGHALVEHWQQARDWNASRRATDQAVDARLALGMVGGYFALDLAMVGTLALSTYTRTGDWRIFIACAYPLIGVATAVVTNQRAHLFRLRQAVELERQERAAVRAEKAARKRNGSGMDPARQTGTDRHDAGTTPERVPAQTGTVPETSDAVRNAAAGILTAHSGISGSELGRMLGRSERLGRKLKAELMPELVPDPSGNGHGG